ncbi:MULTISPECIES: HNH endonuclease [Chryseobacterium]|uniref:HNH endonuclease n=1 Tax=Chryseobacterium gambrini TaxID=373672 RepID=A0A1N7LG15_9FLAO|nr:MULTISPECIES: HNH endonuclease [Chryseobacterium]SIS72757.1 HNH endonuclease [Chryseobacterium gambrini]
MDLDIQKFRKWLEQGGCDILPTTNEYEALKFKGRIIGIVYKSGKTSNKYTARAIRFFKENKKWDGYPPNVGRKSSYKKEKAQILERDGDLCFFCNKKLGDDITLEHLLALSRGGRNALPNMVLMHEKCNNELSNLPLIDKIIKIKEQYGKT